MSDLVAIVYPTEAKAEEVRQRLLKLQKEYLISISDAVIAVKTEAGGIKLNQLVNTTAAGAISGSFWGLLVGVLFLNPIIGVAVGAASGAIGGALSDFGINDAFIKELSGFAPHRQRGSLRSDQEHDGRQGAQRDQGRRRRRAEDVPGRDQGEDSARRACQRRGASGGLNRPTAARPTGAAAS